MSDFVSPLDRVPDPFFPSTPKKGAVEVDRTQTGIKLTLRIMDPDWRKNKKADIRTRDGKRIVAVVVFPIEGATS